MSCCLISLDVSSWVKFSLEDVLLGTAPGRPPASAAAVLATGRSKSLGYTKGLRVERVTENFKEPCGQKAREQGWAITVKARSRAARVVEIKDHQEDDYGAHREMLVWLAIMGPLTLWS